MRTPGGGGPGAGPVAVREDLDGFIEAFRSVLPEAEANPGVIREAPMRCKVKRLDESAATRNPCLTG